MASMSPYTLLHELIDRAAWRSEGEMRAAHESVEEMKQINLFGNLATMMECEHLHTQASRMGSYKCTDCGKEGLAL